MPPETLPGNPTDAGPDTRNEPPLQWSDCIMFAEEELCFARRRNTLKTRMEREALLTAIARAENLLADAKKVIRAR